MDVILDVWLNNRFELFIIADHLSDEQQIREFAEAMIGQGIRDFNFTGKFGQLWDNIFDEVDIDINPDSTEDTVALTMYWEDKDEFDEEIVGALIKSINILTPGVCIELTNREKGLVISENPQNILRPVVLGFSTNKIYDLSNNGVYRRYQIVDIMKTMDNRIKVDRERLEEYMNKR